MTDINTRQDLPAAAGELALVVQKSTEQTSRRLTGLESDADADTSKNMEWLRNAEYERRADDRAIHRAQADLGFIQPRPVMGPMTGMPPLFSSALALARNRATQEGRALPELSEDNNFLYSDIITADLGDPDTREPRTQPVAYALFEASGTADLEDVQRARERAETLALTMGVSANAPVIADTVPEQVAREAGPAGVRIFPAPE